MKIKDDEKAAFIKMNGGILWFIENKSTGLWWHHTLDLKDNLPCTCRKCYPTGYPFKKYKDGWTNDVQKADAYLTKEQAEHGIFFYYTNEPETNLIATEHEFIPSA